MAAGGDGKGDAAERLALAQERLVVAEEFGIGIGIKFDAHLARAVLEADDLDKNRGGALIAGGVTCGLRVRGERGGEQDDGAASPLMPPPAGWA